jgi:AmmeMemoRadiSam system protein B
MARSPAVAGRFYPENPQALLEEVQRHLEQKTPKVIAKGVIAPHAGFMYSGDVAGAVYSRIEIPDTVILLGPNHTGMGERIALVSHGSWIMPFGDLEIDANLAKAILQELPIARENEDAHRLEHSLETQLPFLQYFRKQFKFVPICLMCLSFDECQMLAHAIVRAIRPYDRPVLIVASSDMTHYESHTSASEKDHKAIDQILKMDPEGLFRTVEKEGITMCGVNPATVMLAACKELGATQAELARYMTSGEVSGDMDQVVGYAGVVVH